MSDRELLELAAKAAGYAETRFDEHGRFYVCVYLGEPDKWELWNPLDSDGDAFRLAAKLNLVIRPGKHSGDGCTVEPQWPGVAGCTAHRDDKAEQMRRAIVMVAAYIGDSLKMLEK